MSEIDLDQFIQVLDHALATDDPKIKKALKKFLFIAALAMEGDPEPGPFSEMLEEMDDLRRRLAALEQQAMQKTTFTDLADTWYGSSGTPTWKYTGGTSTNGTVTITPSTTSGNATTPITGGSSCGGFVNPTTTTVGTYGQLGGGYGGFTINLGDDEKGKRIKKELEEKLGGLTKSA